MWPWRSRFIFHCGLFIPIYVVYLRVSAEHISARFVYSHQLHFDGPAPPPLLCKNNKIINKCYRKNRSINKKEIFCIFWNMMCRRGPVRYIYYTLYSCVLCSMCSIEQQHVAAAAAPPSTLTPRYIYHPFYVYIHM